MCIYIYIYHFMLLLVLRNGDGFVDREEFGEILHLTGEPVVEEDIDEMFGEGDTNHDGKIDFDGEVELLIEPEEFLHCCGHAVSSMMFAGSSEGETGHLLTTFSVILSEYTEILIHSRISISVQLDENVDLKRFCPFPIFMVF